MNCNFAPPECRCDTRARMCPGALDVSYEGTRGYECYGRDERTDRPLSAACLDVCDCPPDAAWVSDCRCPPFAEDIVINPCSDPNIRDTSACEVRPLDLNAIYEVATNDYIAHGGSGFVILRNNNTQLDTGLPMREAVLERILRSRRCIDECRTPDGETVFASCATFRDCVRDVEEFHSQFCRRIAETTPGQTRTVARCALDAEACRTDADCHHVDIECALASCTSCVEDIDCDLGLGERCMNGFCRPRVAICSDFRCHRICETDADCPGEGGAGAQHTCVDGRCLPAGGGLCWDERDCTPARAQCFGGGAACSVDRDCDAREVCRGRVCVPEVFDCASDADCRAAGLAASARCLAGRCVPDAEACERDEDCVTLLGDARAACVAGLCAATCQACRYDEGCPPGLVCAGGFCGVPGSACEEHRCRTRCAADDACLPGHRCEEGRCLPILCTTPRDLEIHCHLQNAWKAVEHCLAMACPQSYADGRIRRILPENIENLPGLVELNDPEDLDPDLFGLGD
jgi:hypothetical protein